MSSTLVSNTYSTPTSGGVTVQIPDNHVNLTVEIGGARGGYGYPATASRAGGGGRNGTFQYLSTYNFTSRELKLWPGDKGDNGGSPGGGAGGNNYFSNGGSGGAGQWSYQQAYNCDQGKGYARDCGGSCGCCGNWYCGGSQGNGDPCCGGALGTPNECFCCYEPQTCYNTIYVNTGGGGGGGSSSAVYDSTAAAYLAVGGGGGGGRGTGSSGIGAAGADWTAVAGTFTGFGSGSGGSNTGQNGGTGGGGGGAPGSSWTSSAGSKYNSNLATVSGSVVGTNDPFITVSYLSWIPEIVSNDFYASPNPQTSGNDGTPNYNVTIYFAINNWQYAVLTGNGVNETFYPGDTLSYTDTNLPQSVQDSDSPASVTYTLTAYAGSESDTKNLTVEVTNDNDPSNSWTTSHSNLDQITEYRLNIGTLAGIDMVTQVSTAETGVQFAASQNGSYSNPQYFTNNQTVWMKVTTLPYNTDLTGVSYTANVGNPNTKPVTVVAGTDTVVIDVITKPPVIKEVFDYDGNEGADPYEDIDFNADPATEYVVSQTIGLDDIQIPVEVQTDDPNVQIKINTQDWKSIQEI